MLVEALKVKKKKKTRLLLKIWSPSGAVLKMQLCSASPSGTDPISPVVVIVLMGITYFSDSLRTLFCIKLLQELKLCF